MELDLNSSNEDAVMEVDIGRATNDAFADGGVRRNEVGGEEILVEDVAEDEDEDEDKDDDDDEDDDDDDVLEFVEVELGVEVDVAECVSVSGQRNEVEEELQENGAGIESSDVVTGVEAPFAGMVFPSMEEVDQYYRRYGKQEGFGVVRAGASSYVGRDGVKKPARNATWTCHRYGRPDRRRRVNGKRFVTDANVGEGNPVSISKKCECSAMLYASVNADNVWQVRRVEIEHRNHKLSPLNSKYIAEFRTQELTSHVKRKLRVGFASGLSVAQLHNLMLNERNGLVGLTKRDVRNELGKDKKLKLKDGDADAMIKYFSKMTADSQNFFHAYRLDSNGQMQDILWVDVRSRAAYREFGDVVCFDTTYLTNKYELPFANFVGVNHHGQTILLGCALISRETTETFEWVFSTWLNCMEQKAPIGILTDQAAAMRKALATMMPESKHRWCIWHITSKFGEKFGRRKSYDELREALMNAIFDSLTVEEFERNWADVTKKYKLEEHRWLKGLYREKEMWAPAFLRGFFWTGMKTTQRVESIHSFFDDYVKKHTRLYEFAESYCRAMECRAEEERQYDAHSESCTRQVVHGFPAERLFQRCYTDQKFKDVQRECSRICHLHCYNKVVVSDTIMEYWFEDSVWCVNKDTRKEFLTEYKRKYEVRYDSMTNLAECQCCLFESSGILCRHIIKLYAILSVREVPERYILRRWRKDIQRKHTRIKVAYHDPSKNDQVRGYDELQLAFEPICSKAAAHKQTIRLVRELLQLMDIRVDEKAVMIEKETINVTPCSVNKQNQGTHASTTGLGLGGPTAAVPNTVEEVRVKDPPMRVYAHRTTSKRFLSVREKAVKTRGKGKRQKGKQCLEENDGDPLNLNERPNSPGHVEAPTAPRKTRNRCPRDSPCLPPPDVEDEWVFGGMVDDVSSGSCFQMIDPDGSVGIFKHAAGSQRVLFADSVNEHQGSNVDLHSRDVNTYLSM